MHAASQSPVSCVSAQFDYDRWGVPPKRPPRLGASTPKSTAAKLAPLGQGRRIILHVSEGAHEVLTAPCRFRRLEPQGLTGVSAADRVECRARGARRCARSAGIHSVQSPRRCQRPWWTARHARTFDSILRSTPARPRTPLLTLRRSDQLSNQNTEQVRLMTPMQLMARLAALVPHPATRWCVFTESGPRTASGEAGSCQRLRSRPPALTGTTRAAQRQERRASQSSAATQRLPTN